MNFVPHDSFAPGEYPDEQVPGHVIEAVKAILRWAGDDPEREGLAGTPERVARRRLLPHFPADQTGA